MSIIDDMPSVFNRNRKKVDKNSQREAEFNINQPETDIAMAIVKGLGNEATIEQTTKRGNQYPVLQIAVGQACHNLYYDTIANLKINVVDIETGETSLAPVWLRKPLGSIKPDYTQNQLQGNTASSLFLAGNAFFKKTIRKDNLIGLIPLDPLCVSIEGTYAKPKYKYYTKDKLGSIVNEKEMSARQIHHIALRPPPNSLLGIAPVVEAGIAIRLLIEISVHNVRAIQNALNFTLFQVPVANKEEQDKTKEKFERELVGADRANTYLLGWVKDMETKQIGRPVEEIQVIEIWDKAISDLARAVGVPLSMLGGFGSEQNSYASSANERTTFATNTLIPFANTIANSLSTLLPDNQRLEFDFSSLVEGDFETRANVASKLVGGPIYTADEYREQTGDGEVKGGDKLLRPLQVAPYDIADEIQLRDGLKQPPAPQPSNDE